MNSRFFVHWEVRRYNFHVPTPFYHLSLAQELSQHPGLPAELNCFLREQRCEFLFGNTAPDVQVVAGLPREHTHFFSLPIRADDPPAWEVLLTRYPQLADAGSLPPGKAAFVAGYLCHLQADWLWIKRIFAPVFGPRCDWSSFEQRLYYHNVLRAYLDRCILPGLEAGMDACLCRAKPDSWLPFVESRHLVEWRNFLSQQLLPGAASQTVEVFSSRQGISAPEYYALLGSQERMQKEVFEHISLEQVQSYRQAVLDENTRLITEYLAFALHHNHVRIEEHLPRGACA